MRILFNSHIVNVIGLGQGIQGFQGPRGRVKKLKIESNKTPMKIGRFYSYIFSFNLNPPLPVVDPERFYRTGEKI